MNVRLLPGLTIGEPPLELRLGNDAEPWRSRDYAIYNDDRDRQDILHEATAFPAAVTAGTPDELMAKLFACSGAVDSSRYLEPTKFRAIPDMAWPEARAALNRLSVDVSGYDRGHRTGTEHFVALAEFVLTVQGFTGFQGLRGEHAVKLRDRLTHVIPVDLQHHLRMELRGSADTVRVLACPITNRLQGEGWRGNVVLWAKVPTSARQWVRIIEATPAQMLASLDYLRAVLVTWSAQRPFADEVAKRLSSSSRLPTAAEYAEAIHIANMLAFASAKLDALYAGVMHSMPIYRMHPATSEREAIELWWPWGRPAPLVDGGPAKAPRPRKATLDPSIITAMRPTSVVKQVIEQTGMNRTTAQRLTAGLRRDLRRQREAKARSMLIQGATRTAAAKAVGLSPSRISAMFRGQTFPTKKLVGRGADELRRHRHHDANPQQEDHHGSNNDKTT
jgi:hypothetical protein